MDSIKFGIHLPVMEFAGQQSSKEEIISIAQDAESLGFDSLSVNDHVIFHTGWLDAISTLSAIAVSTSRVRIGTSVLNIVTRNPVVSAKALAAIDILSNGRLFAGVGPGSHRGDYKACNISFEERWSRFSEAVRILIALLDDNNKKALSFHGKYYDLEDISLRPQPVQKPRPPIYIGSWGSDAGLKRVARYSDGWMASAYNTTPAKFKEKWNFLLDYRKSLGIGSESFDSSVMTMFGYIDEDKERVRKVVKEILSPTLGRSAEELERMLLFGNADDCLEKIRDWVDVGVKRVHFWPLMDYSSQMRVFWKEIASAF